jgi:Ca2+-binding RTX toxin-like protein
VCALSLFFLTLAVIGTTTSILGSNTGQAWADVFEGTEGPDEIVGTPEDDQIDSKGGNDFNLGDSRFQEGSGNDNIISGEGNDNNIGNGGDDNIIGRDGDDQLTGGVGRDIFVCGEGEDDTVTDYNEAEGDIATPDCENV